MLKLIVPAFELYDEDTNEFSNSKGMTLQLEHSLVSISKWESKWCKPFLTKERKTYEETIDYIRCMTLTQNVPQNVYYGMSDENLKKIEDYIEAPMTATSFSNMKKSTNREVITTEIIYYWMTALNIPFECQKWHLNRLLTLINVCNIKNQPSKKMSKKEIMNRNTRINANRKQALNTKG